LFNRQNNYVGNSTLKLVPRMLNFLQHCQCLSVLYNYFDGSIKLFADLYLAKLLNISAKQTVLSVY